MPFKEGDCTAGLNFLEEVINHKKHQAYCSMSRRTASLTELLIRVEVRGKSS